MFDTSLRGFAAPGALALLLAAWALGGPAVDFDARFYLRRILMWPPTRSMRKIR